MLTYGFFDSIRANRKYYPHQMTDLFSMVMPEGIVSGIANGFACESTKDVNTIKIRSGFGFFKGYYVYNDSEMTLTIDESTYPAPGLRSIQVQTQPYQIDYPAGVPLDLDGISVFGLKSYASVENIRVNVSPQLDYPYGTKFDISDIQVVGDLADSIEVRVGDCYIVIEFDEANRSFDIKAINTNDFRMSIHYLIAICHKTVSGLRVENVVGKTLEDIETPKWITGLFQSTEIDDIIDNISYEETAYKNEFDSEKSTYWSNWVSTNKYYLHSSGKQYQRLTDELSGKDTKSVVQYHTIPRDTTTTTLYIPEITDKSVLSFKVNPFDLIIRDVKLLDNGYVQLSYDSTRRRYSLCVIIR